MTGAVQTIPCPVWCITNHADDLHGEHRHRSAAHEIGRDSRDRPVDVRLHSTTTDAGDDDGPYLSIGDLELPNRPRLRVYLGGP